MFVGRCRFTFIRPPSFVFWFSFLVDDITYQTDGYSFEFFQWPRLELQYVAEQTRNRSATNTLDSVVVTTVREQAQKRNYRFE